MCLNRRLFDCICVCTKQREKESLYVVERVFLRLRVLVVCLGIAMSVRHTQKSIAYPGTCVARELPRQ